MELQQAKRRRAKIRLAIQGPSGSGKTMSSLLLAYGLCGDWQKIAVIDTENPSASLYSHLGLFNVVELISPYHPERFISAIQLCEKAGMEVIIIDSASAEWSGKGGCLDIHEKETQRMKIPNSFTAWAVVTPLHQSFIEAILQSSCHIIATTRSKTEYALTERNGRMVPQKLGMAPVTRDGFEYEFSVCFDIDQQHKAFVSKDRTGLFNGSEPFTINMETGKQILEWCNSGEQITVDDVHQRINNCTHIKELLNLYQEHPQFRAILKPEFEAQKRRILINQEVKTSLDNTQKIPANGTP